VTEITRATATIQVREKRETTSAKTKTSSGQL
jgi:hypothetical protein